jgi:E3 ubiquitin-protein ligase XIAP/baculoviral IAP repeat-containing protein 2/3
MNYCYYYFPEKKCKICFSDEKEYIILPCYHYGLCQNCAKEIKKKIDNKEECPCPYCRAKITDLFRLFNAWIKISSSY